MGKVEEGESLGESGNTHHGQTHKKQRTKGGLMVHCTDKRRDRRATPCQRGDKN